MNKTIVQGITVAGLSVLGLTSSSLTNLATSNTQIENQTTVKTLTQQELNEQSMLAINWVQQSGEYRALAYQAFNSAKFAFDRARAQGIKNPAVVVDIDETVVDNSFYQAGLIGTNRAFHPESWNQWVSAKRAKAVPGAVEFVNYVNSNQGKVFFISDRDESSTKNSKNNDLELATIINLKALGFTGVNENTLLLKGEFSKLINGKENTSKQLRREAVESGKADSKVYKTVVLVGDNLNDLDAKAGTSNAARRLHVDLNRDRYGVNSSSKAQFEPTYIMLPNPMYGAWESGLYNPQSFGKQQWFQLEPPEKNQQRKEALKSWQ